MRHILTQTLRKLVVSARAATLIPLVAYGQDSQFLFDLGGNLQAEVPEALALPRILGQPQTQVVIPGSPASFSVMVADARGLSYQWQFGGGNIAGATGDTLLLTNASAANEGIYMVTA